jgi:hypothetical protein
MKADQIVTAKIHLVEMSLSDYQKLTGSIKQAIATHAGPVRREGTLVSFEISVDRWDDIKAAIARERRQAQSQGHAL